MNKPKEELNTDKPLFTVPETARYWGISQSLVWAEIKRGNLKPFKIGDRVFFPRAYLDRLCAGE